MPQTIARMAIAWGMVSISVTVHAAATTGHRPELHLVHTRCGGGRVRQRRWCERDQVDVPEHEITRGYQAPDGRVVLLSDEDLADLPLPTARTIEVLAVRPVDELDPMLWSGRSYWLGVDSPVRARREVAARPYALFRDALREDGTVAIAKAALRTRENLVVLRPAGHALAMHLLHWPDQLRPVEEIDIPQTPPARPQELQMARSFLAALGEMEFRLEGQQDEYGVALRRVVTARLEGVEPPHAPAVPTGGGAVDVMAALERSLREAQRARRRAG
jgi:DNA end-binding protein Ku